MSERSQTITNRVVLLSDGGMESLVAASLILERDDAGSSSTTRATLGCIINDQLQPSPLVGKRLQCIKAQSALIASKSIEVMPSESSLLLTLARAIELAGPSGAIYWPIRCGDDATSLQRTMGTMVGMLRIHTQITGSAGPELILPLIDLMVDQVAEIAFELNAPVQSGWPCTTSTDAPCHRCESCRSWTKVLNGTGLPI